MCPGHIKCKNWWDDGVTTSNDKLQNWNFDGMYQPNNILLYSQNTPSFSVWNFCLGKKELLTTLFPVSGPIPRRVSKSAAFNRVCDVTDWLAGAKALAPARALSKMASFIFTMFQECILMRVRASSKLICWYSRSNRQTEKGYQKALPQQKSTHARRPDRVHDARKIAAFFVQLSPRIRVRVYWQTRTLKHHQHSIDVHFDLPVFLKTTFFSSSSTIIHFVDIIVSRLGKSIANNSFRWNVICDLQKIESDHFDIAGGWQKCYFDRSIPSSQ